MSQTTKKWWVLAGVGIASFIGCIDFTIVNTALPTIQEALQLTFSEIQWIMNVFLLMLPVFMVIAGRLGDLYGHRKILYIAVILFGLSSLGAGFSNSLTLLLINRAIQGIAAAGLFPTAAAVVLHAFPENQQGRALGALYSVFGIGLAIGPFIGGAIIALLNWRWIFFVNVPVIVVAFIICLFSVKESTLPKQQRLDFMGVILLIIGLGCFTFAIAEGNNFGWGSALVIVLFIIGILGMLIWFWHELRCQDPLLQLRSFKHRNVICSLLGGLVLGAFYTLAFFLMPLYLDNVRSLSPFYTGLVLMSTSVMLALVSPLVGEAIDHISAKYLICVGMILFIVMSLMQLFFAVHTSFIFVIASFVIFGIGWAMMGTPLMSALVQALPSHLSGVATGSIWTTQNVGAVLGLAIGTAIFQGVVGHAVNNNLPAQQFLPGYHAAMWFLLAIAIISLLIIFFVMRNVRKLADA